MYTREPGGSPVAEKLREIVVRDFVTPLTELLLFVAAREDLRSAVVEPALKRGVHVISYRAASSTFAYQLYGRKKLDQLPILQYLNSLHEVCPTLYIFLDLDPEEAARRICLRGGVVDADKFDKESIEFHTRVRQGFKAFPEFEPGVPCYFVDASQTPDKVLADVLAIMAEHLATFT